MSSVGSYKVGPTGANTTSYKLGPLVSGGGGGGSQTVQTAVTKTASYEVLASDSGTAFDNIGASGQTTFTLPGTPADGLIYTFTSVALDGLSIKATGTEIYFPGSVSSSGGSQTTTTQGASVTIYSHSGYWFNRGGFGGTWTAS